MKGSRVTIAPEGSLPSALPFGALLAVAALAGCSSSPTTTTPQVHTPSVANYLQAVRLEDGGSAPLVLGTPPPAGVGPSVAVKSDVTARDGGTLGVTLTTGAEVIATFTIAVEGADDAFAFQPNNCERTVSLLVDLHRTPPARSFALLVAATGENGATGHYVRIPITVTGAAAAAAPRDVAGAWTLHGVYCPGGRGCCPIEAGTLVLAQAGSDVTGTFTGIADACSPGATLSGTIADGFARADGYLFLTLRFDDGREDWQLTGPIGAQSVSGSLATSATQYAYGCFSAAR